VQNLAKRDEFLQRLLDQQSDDESVQSAADSEFENDSADDPESENDNSVQPAAAAAAAAHYQQQSVQPAAAVSPATVPLTKAQTEAVRKQLVVCPHTPRESRTLARPCTRMHVEPAERLQCLACSISPTPCDIAIDIAIDIETATPCIYT